MTIKQKGMREKYVLLYERILERRIDFAVPYALQTFLLHFKYIRW
ncbi:MAG: hypothetical protein ABW110_20450 [Steroidobacteraceae bacterium]